MATSQPPANPLLSTVRASDSALQVQLHPLVILTISDYITRHTLRQQQGPIVGAIIGQQNGHEITMEHAFECKTQELDTVSDYIVLDDVWFKERLEQFRDVHKAPALDLVGWFTLGPEEGPQAVHVPIMQQLQTNYNDAAVLLLFHPGAIVNGALSGGKLPLSIYEAFTEPSSENRMDEFNGLKFRELAHSVDTSQAEMIAVDFVAKGGGNATAVTAPSSTDKQAAESGNGIGKGKAKATATPPPAATETDALSAEDEEAIASLTAKANAIKMLHQRINLIRAYLSAQPPSYLNDALLASPTPPQGPQQPPQNRTVATATTPNHQILRQILALTSRIPLLTPSDTAAFAREITHQSADVNLVALLANLTKSVVDARAMGRKFAAFERARTDKGNPLGGQDLGLSKGVGVGSGFGSF
ncbi:hypothetical protein LTR16_001753 [Cryomyces antarcticus]|uniref:COP9 signalosome complex subunit 6 n=1 Tax=Cryomyces antarcticus TaxID=329879 RepID=A0ABR0M0R3_9PEZI|nr:hypothetical protein LTR60_001034 [Cryomyces antarcticus]KAK5257047.1 hypothetical protein LTR16_001753 [Cryomyces antarcticus]